MMTISKLEDLIPCPNDRRSRSWTAITSALDRLKLVFGYDLPTDSLEVLAVNRGLKNGTIRMRSKPGNDFEKTLSDLLRIAVATACVPSHAHLMRTVHPDMIMTVWQSGKVLLGSDGWLCSIVEGRPSEFSAGDSSSNLVEVVDLGPLADYGETTADIMGARAFGLTNKALLNSGAKALALPSGLFSVSALTEEQMTMAGSPSGVKAMTEFEYLVMAGVMGITPLRHESQQVEPSALSEGRPEEFHEWEKWVADTADFRGNGDLTYSAIGLIGELGELLGAVAKHWRARGAGPCTLLINDLPEQVRAKLKDESYDVLHFLTFLIHEQGLTISDVIRHGREKLERRMRDGTLHSR